MEGVTVFEHTADVGIVVSASTFEQALERAILGMCDLMVPVSQVSSVGEEKIIVDAADDGRLVVDLLTEVLFIVETQSIAVSDAKVTLTDAGAEAVVRGEALDLEKHSIEMEVKAVTCHMLEAYRDPPYIKVLFDI